MLNWSNLVNLNLAKDNLSRTLQPQLYGRTRLIPRVRLSLNGRWSGAKEQGNLCTLEESSPHFKTIREYPLYIFAVARKNIL